MFSSGSVEKKKVTDKIFGGEELKLETYRSFSVEETLAIGRHLAKKIFPSAIICFFGDLAAGKTSLIKGIVSELTGTAPEEVSSPTFVYMTPYEGSLNVYHFDLYRLNNPEEFLSMGFDEYFYAGGVSCVEWSERIESLLPSDRIEVTLSHLAEGERLIVVSGLEGRI